MPQYQAEVILPHLLAFVKPYFEFFPKNIDRNPKYNYNSIKPERNRLFQGGQL